MKKRILSITVCLLMAAGMFLVTNAQLSAETEMTANQKKEEAFVQYIEGHFDKKTAEISDYFSLDGNLKEKLSGEETVYEVGENIAITKAEIQQYKTFYELKGEANPLEMAIDYAEKRSALYVEAIRNDYDVTDAEIYAYLEKLKETLKETLGAEEYENLMASYETEEEYWEYEFQVYKVNLPIQNYVSDLEQRYCQTQGIDNNTLPQDDGWNEQFESIKKELVEKQAFEVL